MIECNIEEYIPIPTAVARPYANLRERAEAACKAAIKLLDEGYVSGSDAPVVDTDIRKMMEAVVGGKELGKNFTDSLLSTPAGSIRVHNIISEYDQLVVHDAIQIRTYVTNKLIIESDSIDPRIRIKALELLGKISDVGLFSERTEITITNKSTLELENSLKDKLKRLMGVEEAEDAVVVPTAVVPIRTVNLNGA